jgi:TrpR-related protein YerC/YecD
MEDDHHHSLSALCQAFLSLASEEEMFRFLKDLCTPQEISVISERWRVCRLLNQGNLSYRAIQKQTGASLATIGRVARFLKDESYDGYRLALQRTSSHELLSSSLLSDEPS